ncbi:hypothetical protein, partial [Haloferula sp. A504]|uniref:hypothetical protein n=1 Tax=Haloferula sp. A504 TaxID=3373601 RepID=UPI0031C74119|nr:hypothetical protein [Verrucomicrobiaceae bacterium E54]
MRLLIPVIVGVVSAHLAGAEDPKFGALAEDYEAKAKIVKRLDEIMLKDVRINGLSIGEAVALVQALGSDGEKGGVINFFIRRPPALGADGSADPFAPHRDGPAEPRAPKKPVRITLNVDTISFAHAIDRICAQAGYRWEIGGDRESYPILEIYFSALTFRILEQLEVLGNQALKACTIFAAE